MPLRTVARDTSNTRVRKSGDPYYFWLHGRCGLDLASCHQFGCGLRTPLSVARPGHEALMPAATLSLRPPTDPSPEKILRQPPTGEISGLGRVVNYCRAHVIRV